MAQLLLAYQGRFQGAYCPPHPPDKKLRLAKTLMTNSHPWFYNNQKNHAANLPPSLRSIRKELTPIVERARSLTRIQVSVRFDNDRKAHEQLIKLAEKYGRSPGEQLKRMAFSKRP